MENDPLNNNNHSDNVKKGPPSSLPKLKITRPLNAGGPRRKFSFPAALSGTDQLIVQTARRRFSNVGDAVSRKLSTTIGWRPSAGPPQDVITVGRALCSLYIRNRLKRAGVFTRKLGLSRLRSTVGSMVVCGTVARDVFPCLNCAGSELEHTHPRLYTNVARQVSRDEASGVAGILVAVGHQLLRTDPTWGKVISIFCVAGGLAVDSVRHGHPENLNDVVEGMTELLEDRMAEWIASNGGWNALSGHCRQEDSEVSFVEYSAIFVLVAAVLIVAYFFVRFFIKISV